MKINRKKMETEKWAVGRWAALGDEQAYWNDKKNISSPFMQGSEIKSKLLRKKIYKEQERIERKIRQVELILKKIGYDYK